MILPKPEPTGGEDVLQHDALELMDGLRRIELSNMTLAL